MFKAIKKLAGVVLGVLVIAGVIKGLAAYNASAEDGRTLLAAMLMVVTGIADMTVFLVPTIIEFFAAVAR